MQEALLVVHVLIWLALIGLVLLQQGKGADAGAAFGGGSSQSLFGSRGSANFLSRSTAILAVLFFATSVTLAIMAVNKKDVSTSVMQQSPVTVELPEETETVMDEEQLPEDDYPELPPLD